MKIILFILVLIELAVCNIRLTLRQKFEEEMADCALQIEALNQSAKEKIQEIKKSKNFIYLLSILVSNMNDPKVSKAIRICRTEFNTKLNKAFLKLKK